MLPRFKISIVGGTMSVRFLDKFDGEDTEARLASLVLPCLSGLLNTIHSYRTEDRAEALVREELYTLTRIGALYLKDAATWALESEEPPKASPWLPLASCLPIEGRRVLLFVPGRGPVVGHWSADPHGPPYARRPGWRDSSTGLEIWSASHWTSLPEPPE